MGVSIIFYSTKERVGHTTFMLNIFYNVHVYIYILHRHINITPTIPHLYNHPIQIISYLSIFTQTTYQLL